MQQLPVSMPPTHTRAPLVFCCVYPDLRYGEIAPLFSVAKPKQEFQTLPVLITKVGVRGDVGSEKYAKNLGPSFPKYCNNKMYTVVEDALV